MKVATKADYVAIARLLTTRSSCVLVTAKDGSTGSYSLRDIAQGPFTATEDGVTGFSLNGFLHTLRLSEVDSHIELKKDGGHWYAPEEGRLILEIPA